MTDVHDHCVEKCLAILLCDIISAYISLPTIFIISKWYIKTFSIFSFVNRFSLLLLTCVFVQVLPSVPIILNQIFMYRVSSLGLSYITFIFV